jgi:hypothetical protein
VRARHVGLGPGLVDEDQAGGIKPSLKLGEPPALLSLASDDNAAAIATAGSSLKLVAGTRNHLKLRFEETFLERTLQTLPNGYKDLETLTRCAA